MKHDNEFVNPVYRSRSRLATAVILGAIVGVLTGLLLMSLGLLLMGALSLLIDTSPLQLPGLSMPVVTFVTFFVLGWVGASIVIYYRVDGKGTEAKNK